MKISFVGIDEILEFWNYKVVIIIVNIVCRDETDSSWIERKPKKGWRSYREEGRSCDEILLDFIRFCFEKFYRCAREVTRIVSENFQDMAMKWIHIHISRGNEWNGWKSVDLCDEICIVKIGKDLDVDFILGIDRRKFDQYILNYGKF